MNAQCAIFAESEVVGLIHAKTEKQDISKAIHDAMASRVVSMVRRIGVNDDVVMMGGVAYNPGFVEALKRQLDLQKLYIPDAPEYGMAVGAAVAAAEEAQNPSVHGRGPGDRLGEEGKPTAVSGGDRNDRR